jgi:hypothetical protein
MRRLLSPVRLLAIHLPSAEGRTPVAIPAAPPAAFFGFSLPVSVGWAGALPQFRPSPLFGGEPR